MLRSLLLAFLLVGCTPRLAPLYSDFTAPEAAAPRALEQALEQAGWMLAAPSAEGVVTTAPRTVSEWGLYRVVVAVDVVPLGGQHVRVLFHPFRRYFTGGRSKISYLPSGVRRQLLPPLTEALEARGYHVVLSGKRADRAARAGTR